MCLCWCWRTGTVTQLDSETHGENWPGWQASIPLQYFSVRPGLQSVLLSTHYTNTNTREGEWEREKDEEEMTGFGSGVVPGEIPIRLQLEIPRTLELSRTPCSKPKKPIQSFHLILPWWACFPIRCMYSGKSWLLGFGVFSEYLQFLIQVVFLLPATKQLCPLCRSFKNIYKIIKQ